MGEGDREVRCKVELGERRLPRETARRHPALRSWPSHTGWYCVVTFLMILRRRYTFLKQSAMYCVPQSLNTSSRTPHRLPAPQLLSRIRPRESAASLEEFIGQQYLPRYT
ncbi:hypothetical protein PoB_003891300 [Plakobranchus ocellatus]|uniref:Uncharacterized protein n=1 Tax=Plakobranchus ocellatus TaxID=259542 RepID=A0AAV4AZX7_9GAST|nr:hypothetical protein PoB_003891300 [Plakobranchus ocellatus]